MRNKLPPLLFTLVLLASTAKIFAQAPYEWPIINSQLPNDITTATNAVNAKWNAQGYTKYCTNFSGALMNVNSNIGYYIFTPTPAPGALPNAAWENFQLGRADTELMMMDTLGYKAVDIISSYPLFVHGFPNSQVYLDFYKRVYALARKHGFKIILNCQVELANGFAETNVSNDIKNFYYSYNGVAGDTITTLEYEQSMNQEMQTAIDSLTPDYMTLEMEPETQAANIFYRVSFAPDSTLKYVNYFLSNLNLHGKKVLLGAGALNSDPLTYFENYATTAVDYLDYHMYTVNKNIYDPITFRIDSIAVANNKRLVVGESWATKMSDSEWVAHPNPGYWATNSNENNVFNYFETIDTLFTQSMIDLSQQANIDLLNFFNTPVEFGYISWKSTYSSMSQSAITDQGSDTENVNLYNMQLGALGKFTKMAIARANLPVLSLHTVSGVSVCNGTPANLSANGNVSSGTISYTWAPGSLSGTSPSVTPSVNTNYTVTANVGGCTQIDSELVAVNPLPNITISGNSSLPLGRTDTLTAHGGISYVWTSGNTNDTAMVKPQTNNTYTVTGEGSDGCYNTATFTVTVIPLGINTITSLDKTSVYPNPGTDNLNLLFEMQGGEKVAMIEVTDLSGKEIMNENATIGNGKIVTLDVSTLAQGLYFVKVVSDSNTSLVKFIKQ